MNVDRRDMRVSLFRKFDAILNEISDFFPFFFLTFHMIKGGLIFKNEYTAYVLCKNSPTTSSVSNENMRSTCSQVDRFQTCISRSTGRQVSNLHFSVDRSTGFKFCISRSTGRQVSNLHFSVDRSTGFKFVFLGRQVDRFQILYFFSKRIIWKQLVHRIKKRYLKTATTFDKKGCVTFFATFHDTIRTQLLTGIAISESLV